MHSAKKPSNTTWESYWTRTRDPGEVYSNDDRGLRNLLGVIDPRGSSVLEVGAGTGRDSLGLARLGASVVQLDYSMGALRLARDVASRAGARVLLLAGDALVL